MYIYYRKRLQFIFKYDSNQPALVDAFIFLVFKFKLKKMLKNQYDLKNMKKNQKRC